MPSSTASARPPVTFTLPMFTVSVPALTISNAMARLSPTTVEVTTSIGLTSSCTSRPTSRLTTEDAIWARPSGSAYWNVTSSTYTPALAAPLTTIFWRTVWIAPAANRPR